MRCGVAAVFASQTASSGVLLCLNTSRQKRQKLLLPVSRHLCRGFEVMSPDCLDLLIFVLLFLLLVSLYSLCRSVVLFAVGLTCENNSWVRHG